MLNHTPTHGAREADRTVRHFYQDRSLHERRCRNDGPDRVCAPQTFAARGCILRYGRHGEVFVLNDGGEVDLDLGNYERYLNITLTRDNNITTGKIYQHVIEREVRAFLERLGNCWLISNSDEAITWVRLCRLFLT